MRHLPRDIVDLRPADTCVGPRASMFRKQDVRAEYTEFDVPWYVSHCDTPAGQ